MIDKRGERITDVFIIMDTTNMLTLNPGNYLADILALVNGNPGDLIVELPLMRATGVFGDDANAEPAAPTVDVKTLRAEIGERTLENDFLPFRPASGDCRAERSDRP